MRTPHMHICIEMISKRGGEKMKFVEPSVEISTFEMVDVITTSGLTPGENDLPVN